MNKEELQELINQKLSINQLSKHFKKSKSTIIYWLKKFDLKTLYLQYNKGPDSLYCVVCKTSAKEDFYTKGYRRFKCKTCHKKRIKEKTDNRKIELINYKGGKCLTCGYDKCIAALEFHHRDPSQKDPDWSKSRKHKFEKIKDELDKCDLLCANCHREVHFNNYDK
jgi:hypothetical protein